MPCYSPLKGYKSEETGGLVFRRDNTKETMEVACGQCIGCRLDRSRMWAMRIVHESTLHEDKYGNSFITLTYRNRNQCNTKQKKEQAHIPEDWSLSKEHYQKFMKRLRKSRSGSKLKFYHCGEYGNICRHGIDLTRVKCPLCNVGRPHYHAILFNCRFDDMEQYSENDKGEPRYTSPELERIWGKGFVDVGEVTFQSAAYVARYIMKKRTGPMAHQYYENIDEETGEIREIEPEYSTMSNGIGKEWYEKYKTDLFPSDEVPVPGQGVIPKVPRYYQERYGEEDPEGLEEVKLLRRRYRKVNEAEYTPERLMSKYKVKKAQVSLLGRTL